MIANYSLPVHIPIGCFPSLLFLFKILPSLLHDYPLSLTSTAQNLLQSILKKTKQTKTK